MLLLWKYCKVKLQRCFHFTKEMREITKTEACNSKKRRAFYTSTTPTFQKTIAWLFLIVELKTLIFHLTFFYFIEKLFCLFSFIFSFFVLFLFFFCFVFAFVFSLAVNEILVNNLELGNIVYIPTNKVVFKNQNLPQARSSNISRKFLLTFCRLWSFVYPYSWKQM